MKLSVKISLLIGTVVLVTSVGIGLIALQISSTTLERTILDGIGAKNESNAELLSAMLSGELNVLGEIANRARTRTMDWDNIQPTLIPDVPRLDVLDLALAAPDGISRYVLDGTTVEIRDRDYFRRAMAGEKNIEVVFSRLSGRLMVMLAVPVFRNDTPGAPVIGVLIALKDGGRALSDVVANLKSTMPSGYSYLVDREGTIIAHRNTEYVTSQFNPIKAAETDASYKAWGDLTSTALRTRYGASRYSYEGMNLIGQFTEVPDFSWLFSVQSKKAM